MSHPYTPIFPPDVLPVRSGVYFTQSVDEDGKAFGSWGFSYFDATDRIWGCSHEFVEAAAAYPEFEFAIQTKRWRGLSEESKS